MNITIRPFHADDMEAVVELSLRAWEPVFQSFQAVLGPAIYRQIYPDWQPTQRGVVERMCGDEKYTTMVAEYDGVVAGFVVCELDIDEGAATGEIHLLAVDPRFQRRGIATQLNRWALDFMKSQGMRLAVVGTGGDPGHAPARRAYEKVGYRALPIVRYYQEL